MKRVERATRRMLVALPGVCRRVSLMMYVAGVVVVSAAAQDLQPGLVATYTDSRSTVVRVVPTPNFRLEPAESIHPQIGTEFTAEWVGVVKIDRAGDYTFSADAEIEIAGKRVAGAVKLSTGQHPLRLRYQRREPEARLQLRWASPYFRSEPVPSAALAHRSAPPEVAANDSIEHGRFLFAELGCGNCHAASDWNLQSRRGPDLSDAAARLDGGWTHSWLNAPREYRPSAVMPVTLRTVRDRADMTAFLASLGQSPARPIDRQTVAEQAEHGKVLFEQTGCVKCHDKQNNLDRVSAKYTSLDALTALIANPHQRDPGGRMPQLFDPQTEMHLARSVAGHLLSAERNPYPAAPAGDATRGAQLFTSRGCASCHSLESAEDRIDLTRVTRGKDFGQPKGMPLRHYWDFQALSDRTVKDRVGHNHGSVSGRPSLADSGRSDGKAFDFDGRAFVELTHFHRPDTMTISAWVRTESGGSIITWGRPGGGTRGSRELRMNIGQDGKNSLCYGEYNSDGGWRPVVVRPTDVNLIDGQWHHIALVRDGEMVQHFIDGKAAGKPGRTQRGGGNYTDRLLIGALGLAADPTNRFRGQIDDVSLWDMALNAEQVGQLAAGRDVLEMAVPTRVEIAPFNIDAGCLSDNVPGPLPDYQLNESDRTALRRFLGTVHPANAGGAYHPAPLTTHDLRVKQFRCTACHELHHENIQQAVTVDEDGRFVRVERPPVLTGVGSKLKSSWLNSVLMEKQRNRPWLNLRMPHFGHGVSDLTDLIGKSAGATAVDHAPVPDVGLAKAGIEMIGERRGQASCIACHNYRGINRQKDGVVPAPDLAQAGQTIRSEWFDRWMHNPTRLQPGTSMPQLFLDVSNEDREQRIDELWSALVHQDRMPLPNGLLARRTEGTRIVVGDQPVLFRMSTRTPVGQIDRAINVGIPGGLNYTFDAVTCRLCYAWRGAFIDAGPAWNGRGGNPVSAGNDALLKLAVGHVVLVGDGPTADARRFLGYRLVAGAPVFRYRVNGATVEHAVVVTEDKIVQRFTVRGAAANVFYVGDDTTPFASATGSRQGSTIRYKGADVVEFEIEMPVGSARADD